MAFNPADFGATPATSQPPTFNPADFGATPAQPVIPQAPANGVTNPLGKAVVGFGNAADDTINAVTGNSGTPLDAVNPIGWASKAFGGVVNGAAKGIGAVGDALKPAASAVGSAARNLVGGQNVDNAVNAVAQSPVGQTVSKLASDPDLKAGLGAVGNVANAAATTVGLAEGARALGGVGEQVAPLAKNLQENAVGQSAMKATADMEKDWTRPTTVAKSSYNKATAIADKAEGMGNDIPHTLAKNKIQLSDNVEGKNYSTADTAEQLRTDAMKASNEMLRPALQQADLSTPKTPVEEVINKTIEDIRRTPKLTADDMEAQIAATKAKGEALARRYPSGMGLTDMHDERIAYTSNKYSPVGPKSDTNLANTDRALGRSLGKTVEVKAPAGVPAREFQGELQKQFQAADYLDSLHGKPVPRTVLSRIANTAGKAIGAKVGSMFGGGLMGGVAGYHIGGMVESMLEGIPTSFRGQFLNNLAQSNPEAFQAVQQYMGNEVTAQSTRLALPAPIAPGNPGARPIIPRAPLPADEGRAPVVNYHSVPQLQLPAGSDATANPVSTSPIPLRSKTLPPQNPLNPTRFPQR